MRSGCADREAREALIDSLEIGDLVRINGRLRVVRDVTHGASPKRGRQRRHCSPVRVRSVTFAILRCSWTRKPFTTYGRTDLYLVALEVVQRGYGVAHGPLEVMLQADIAHRTGRTILECCDVIGVIT